MTENDRFLPRAMIEDAHAEFKIKSEWRGLSAECAAEAFARYLKDDYVPDPELTSHERTWMRNLLMASGFAKDVMDQRSDEPMQITQKMGYELLNISHSFDGAEGVCPGIFWYWDGDESQFTIIDNRGKECRVSEFSDERRCLEYLEGLNPMSNWDKHSLDPDFDSKVNRLAMGTICPITPDPELSAWDMHRYGYGFEDCVFHVPLMNGGTERLEWKPVTTRTPKTFRLPSMTT